MAQAVTIADSVDPLHPPDPTSAAASKPAPLNTQPSLLKAAKVLGLPSTATSEKAAKMFGLVATPSAVTTTIVMPPTEKESGLSGLGWGKSNADKEKEKSVDTKEQVAGAPVASVAPVAAVSAPSDVQVNSVAPANTEALAPSPIKTDRSASVPAAAAGTSSPPTSPRLNATKRAGVQLLVAPASTSLRVPPTVTSLGSGGAAAAAAAAPPVSATAQARARRWALMQEWVIKAAFQIEWLLMQKDKWDLCVRRSGADGANAKKGAEEAAPKKQKWWQSDVLEKTVAFFVAHASVTPVPACRLVLTSIRSFA